VIHFFFPTARQSYRQPLPGYARISSPPSACCKTCFNETAPTRPTPPAPPKPWQFRKH